MESGWLEVSLLVRLIFNDPAEAYNLGAADPATHKIYIWDLSNDGQFASTLDGGREPLVHLHVRAICQSVVAVNSSFP